MGDIAGSLRILESAIEIAPLDRILLDNLSGGYIRHGQFEDAQAIIERLMTVSPYMAHSRAAHLATAQGRWADNAIALIQKLAIAPQSSNFWARRIVGDDLALVTEAFTLGDADSYCGLYALKGQTDEQVQCIQKKMETRAAQRSRLQHDRRTKRQLIVDSTDSPRDCKKESGHFFQPMVEGMDYYFPADS